MKTSTIRSFLGFPLLLLCFAMGLSSIASVAAPIPYSGKVAINGANFQGAAHFTFALRDANGTVHWRNGADANDSIELNVDRGLYISLLGGNEMNDFPRNLFLDNPELFLVVGFYRADTQEWLHLQPDQRITSAPHALAADVANLANLADAVKPGSITKSMLAAEVLAGLNATVVLPEQDASIQTGSITRDMLSPSVRSDLNRTIEITRSMLPADVLAEINRTVVITRDMLPADVLADLNSTISRSRLAADVLSDLDAGIPTDSVTLAMLAPQVRSDLNASITRSRLAGDVLADLNATITRSRLAADVLADLDHSIASGSITRDMLAADVRTDLNASLSSASVTAANIHPDLVKYFLPEISNHPAGLSILQGTGTTLSSAASGKFLTYQWQKNGVDLAGETNATLVLTGVNAAHDGNYTVVVSNDWGSVTSNVSTFTVATNSPVITLVGAGSVTHEAATSYSDSGATAVDALDGNLTASIVVAGHGFDNTAIGDHNVTFNVSDAGGNAAAQKVRTVTVVDTTVPVITLVGDANVSHPITTAWNDPGTTATDTRDGNLSAQVAVSGTVDVNATGANVLTYNVSDAAGNAATPVTRTVNVIPVGPWNFTNAAATGRTGPTQAQVNVVYAGGSLASKVTITTQGIQQWTVPATGTYRIEVWGASTPDQSYYENNNDHGLGARMKGDFNLAAGDILQILVGQKPTQSLFNGGGGGTFVAKGASHANAIALIVAGGGGSHRSNYSASGFEDLLDGITGTAGVTTTYAGGTNGGGGGADTDSPHGGGGAGFTGNGSFPSLTGYSPAYSFQNGGVGGSYEYSSTYTTEGGFGGGGAGGWIGTGGGGGYSGGGAGDNGGGVRAQGGGGGSYNTGTNKDNTAGANEGHGKVTITFVGN